MSRKFFETNPVISRLCAEVAEDLKDNFGHGMKHAVRVAADAGALMLIECGKGSGYSETLCNLEARLSKGMNCPGRRLLIAQCAGLLHDIMRKETEHAVKGAVRSRKMLADYPLSRDEVEDVSQAIRNHEAFRDTLKIDTPEGLLLSDCLYDADKFRWGPDNFEDTIWDMLLCSRTPLSKFIRFYPRGMEMLENVRHTFRTPTGRKYGPHFIDMGLAIGKDVYEIIKTQFSHYL